MSSSSPHRKPDQTVIDSSTIKDGDKVTIKPGALDIIWGADRRYWQITNNPMEPVVLLQVSWLEVTGSLDLKKLNPRGVYTVSFRVSLKPDAFGWTDSPVYLMAKAGKSGTYQWKKADLSAKEPGKLFTIPENPVQKITVPEKVDGEKLLFGMYEIWKGRWKGGLVIHDVIIEPFRAEPQT